MQKQNVLIFFGGNSPEHEVSVITGLQIVENIDKQKYTPHAVYVNKQGELQYLEGLVSRKEFFTVKKNNIVLGSDQTGAFMQITGKLLSSKIYIDIAYLAFHGGLGECGGFQGMLDVYQIPYTSPGIESSVVAMNKALTKKVLLSSGLPSVAGHSFSSTEIKNDVENITNTLIKELNLPVIIKPAHFGSSIGINIAKTEVELQKRLLEAAMIDSEVLVEKVVKGFTEYNASVRVVGDEVRVSEIEKPISQDEILSFADKYERGAKKSGGDGMASLHRQLPADITDNLKEKLQDTAKEVFKALRCKGLVRIDFMVVTEDEFYVTEVNSIPGSMSYYLWEASGVSFTEQITELLQQAERDFVKAQEMTLDYDTDIVQKFVSA